MFRIFRASRKVAGENPFQEKVAFTIVSKVLWLQGKWALFMDRKVKRLSTRSKKFGLIIFVGLSVLICISIVIETFKGTHKTGTLKIGKIRSGKHASSTGEVYISSSIPESQYKRIVAFHHYMDSLSASVPGRKTI